MSDYIDLEKACSAMPDDYYGWRDKKALESIPAADVRPVVHGKWIWDDEGYHCSECFYHAYGETGEVLSDHWHFCPNCGAKMDEEGKE